jgi:hypothetical protein
MAKFSQGDLKSGQSEHVLIIIIVFGLILGSMMLAFFVNCMKKIVRDHKIIRVSIKFQCIFYSFVFQHFVDDKNICMSE